MSTKVIAAIIALAFLALGAGIGTATTNTPTRSLNTAYRNLMSFRGRQGLLLSVVRRD